MKRPAVGTVGRTRPSRSRGRDVPAAAALGLLLSPLPGMAQDVAIDVQRFDVEAQLRTFSLVRDAEQARPGTFGGQLGLSYAWNPFELGNSDGSRAVGIVDHLLGFEAGLIYAPTSWLQIGLSFPFLQVDASGEDTRRVATTLGASGANAGVGDLSLALGFAPLRQADGHALSLAIVPRFVFPTGSAGMLVGSGAFSLGGDVAVGRRWERVRLAAHLGYLWQSTSTPLAGTYADDTLRYGLGLGVPLAKGTWELDLEWAGGAVVLGEGAARVGDTYAPLRHAPMEVLLAAMWLPPELPLSLRFGAGRGLTSGYGAPDLRLFVEIEASRTEVVVRDRDGDGLRDDVDVCPLDPEDLDGFEDSDGCPELDHDQDGLPDIADACPLDREDVDGFEDTDGCPDLDNDGDGVPDTEDGHRDPSGILLFAPGLAGFGDCMLAAEDIDGFADADGCPDPDNDGDGIPDTLDGHRTLEGTLLTRAGFPSVGDCADLPEVRNGVTDDDGCPDEALVRLDTEKREIVILEEVFFDYDRATIKEDSYPVLEAVLRVLKAYPDLRRVEIQGHTDSRGNDAYNLRLSQARVDAVRGFLVERGVASERLSSVGYGEQRPRVPGATSDAEHAQNRRVQFVILDPGTDPAPAP